MAVIWEGYLDESTTDEQEHGGGRVYSVACLIATSEVWDDLAVSWNEAMKSCRAEGKVLHMKHLLHGAKGTEWEGWDEERRRPLLDALATVIESYPIIGYCGSIPLDAHEELYLPHGGNDGPMSPYQLALHGTMEAFIDASVTLPPALKPSPDNPVMLFMERNQLVEADLTHQFFHLTASRKWEAMFPSIVPVPKGPPPLQAADMVAYEGSTHSSRHVVGSSGRPRRRLFERLAAHPLFTFVTASREMLAAHVKDLIDLRRTLGPDDIADIDARYEAARVRMQRVRDPNQ